MTAKLSPRYVSKGRANPWSSLPPRRFRAMRPTYLVEDEPQDKWPLPIKLFLTGMLGWSTWLTIGGM